MSTGPGAKAAPCSATELFFTFSGISLQAFGGALALMERTIVQKKRWLTPQEFLGLFGVGQVLPGPTGIAFCVLLGDRYFGFRGAAAALGGFLGPPAVGVLLLAALLQNFQQLPGVQGALYGMGAAATALVMHSAWRLLAALRGWALGLGVAAASFAAVAVLRLPVGWVMATLGVTSVAWAWREAGREGGPS